ncbi:hypothetical protein EP1X_04215 [Thermococcus sp. EP1]|uniref:hypothetical protein n=1 Tax=Thermococcus sp. EP1 TaxID=1591054 RepID=UPI0006DA382A|nr:hypothetical protein [Thermococcus sp. EP1]KPU63543.1 hypothetical protein EP1X_04215 [Thermococcus sp. EP1]
MIGMFIFGGKKKEEKKRRVEEKKLRLPESVLVAIQKFHARANKGYIKLVAEADPEKNESRAMRIMDAEQRHEEGNMYISALKQKKYQKVGAFTKFEERPPRGLPIVHGFLALLLSYHSGKVLPEIGHAVGDAIDKYYFAGERDISDIKKNPEEFAALVARELKENNIITDEEKAKQAILRGLPTIIRIAEKLWPENHDPEHLEKASNALYKGVEDPIHILRQVGIDIEPELEEFRQLLAEISGKEVRPKFPETKKAVEEELRAKGVPEEQIKVVAARLATAVWLENQLRALKESSTARLYGGVSLIEIRNLREKIVAKKHVAEKAMEHIEKYWMKGAILPLEERHIDPKMLPFVREHAAGMMKDIKNLAERVKRGELDPQDVRNILTIERDLLDVTHEAIERTIGNPENLMKNRGARGVEDKFMIKREAIEAMHIKLKPHFETARVKVPVKGDLIFNEL